MERRDCSVCLYYRQQNQATGMCHRYPQQQPFPPGHWCGEWAPIPTSERPTQPSPRGGLTQAGRREKR